MKHILVVLLGLFVSFISLQTIQANDVAKGSVVASGRKSVSVYASNASEARATAERQNPGWRVVSVRKVNLNDPLSRLWEVVMVK